MERIRRSKKRNYTIFVVLSALLLTVGYATFAQPLAHRLATILPDNSRFGLWYGDGSNDGGNGDNKGYSNGNKGYNKNNRGYNKDNRGYNNNYGNRVSTKQWDIEFIGAKKISTNGNAIEKYPATFENLFATFYVLLSEPGDSITYEFAIKNKGVLNAKLEGYTVVTTNNDVFKFKVEGVSEGDTLDVGETKKIRITTTYNSEYNGDPQTHTGKILVSFRYVQK